MSTADSHPTGAALIGVGMVSATYAQALADLAGQVELTGALGRSPRSGAAFLAKHPIGAGQRAYETVQQVAEDPAVDFVLLTTPPNGRADIVATLAAAGKPILMEKPVERTLVAAIGLCETCEAHGVPLGIMLQHRIRPSVRALVERQQGGTFGALRAVEISVPWWRAQAYYDEPGRGSYERDGGGVLISQAIHTIDLALQFTGPVAEVVALSATTGFHRMESEDFVSAGLQFAGGAVGTLFASTASFPGRTEEIILHYENGSARLQSNLLMLDWQDGRSETIGAAAASGAGADPMAFTSDWHRMMIEDFRDSLATGRAPLAAGRSALPAHALIEAIEESGKTGARCAVQQLDGE